MQQMMDRASRLEGGIGVELSPRQSAQYSQRPRNDKKKKKRRETKYGDASDHWNNRGGVVGAHERKLAWCVAGGGYDALEEAEKWIRRMDRNGDSFLSCKQVAAAMREAGYDLTDDDMQNVLNGFGSDDYGRVDVNEFLQAIHDIASENGWYHHDHKLPGGMNDVSASLAGRSSLPSSVLRKSGEFMHGTNSSMFNGLQTGYEGAWDEFDGAKERGLVEAALREVIEQVRRRAKVVV